MRVAIITGTSRGLGEGLADACHAQGWHVLCLARLHSKRQQSWAEAGSASLGLLALDTLDEAKAGHLAALIPAAATEIMFIANAAVVWPVSRVGDAGRHRIPEAIATNITGSILLAEGIVREALKRGIPLTVLNISSGAARRALPGWSIYCASKAAMDMYFDSLVLDHPTIILKRVDPGVMDTGMQADIRASDPAAFPLHEDFQRLSDQGLLRPASDVARDIVSGIDPRIPRSQS